MGEMNPNSEQKQKQSRSLVYKSTCCFVGGMGQEAPRTRRSGFEGSPSRRLLLKVLLPVVIMLVVALHMPGRRVVVLPSLLTQSAGLSEGGRCHKANVPSQAKQGRKAPSSTESLSSCPSLVPRTQTTQRNADTNATQKPWQTTTPLPRAPRPPPSSPHTPCKSSVWARRKKIIPSTSSKPTSTASWLKCPRK